MATEKYMGVAGQSFYSEDADKYFRDIFRGRVLDAVINDKSSLDVVWNMYEYGAGILNSYYNNGVDKFIDQLPLVKLTGVRVDSDALIPIIESQTSDTIVEMNEVYYSVLAPITSPYTEKGGASTIVPYDIKFTMDDDRWYYWELYIKYVLQEQYSYNLKTDVYYKDSNAYKVDWNATGDPIGIDYSLGDNALDNTDYAANEAQYEASPFIVANNYTSTRTTIDERTTITITNKDIDTDSKRVVISHITTVYDTFGTQQGQSTQIISDTLYDIPTGSESPSSVIIRLSDETVEDIGSQVTWFLGSLPAIITVTTELVDVGNGDSELYTTTTPIYYYFSIYTNTNNNIKIWLRRESQVNLPSPKISVSNEGNPKGNLSVMPVVTLMNNDKILSETNNPVRYESTNKLLKPLNLNVDMLNDALETKEAIKQSSDSLLIWMAKYFTTETLDNVLYPNPDYDPNYDASKYPSSDKTNRWDKYLLDPEKDHIQNIVNNGLKHLTEAEATTIVNKMLADLMEIHRRVGGVYDCAWNPQVGYDPDRGEWYGGYPCTKTENPPDIKEWEESFTKGLLRWFSSQLNLTMFKITNVSKTYDNDGNVTSTRIVITYRIIKYDIEGNEISRVDTVVSDLTHLIDINVSAGTVNITGNTDKKVITAIGVLPDNALILKRMNVYIRDIKTVYDTMEGDIEDVFVVMGVNPITTAFATGYDWTLPDNAKASETEVYNKAVEANYKKKGVEVISKVLFNYFSEIYTTMGIQGITTTSYIQMDIEESPYFMHWRWKPYGTPIRTVQGNVLPKGHYMHMVRWYHKDRTDYLINDHHANYSDKDWSLEMWVYYQDTATSYKLIHINDWDIWYESRRHGKTTRVPERDKNPTNDTSANKACLIPLPFLAIRTLSITEKMELFPYSLHMIVFAVKKVKTKWYESSVFGFLLMAFILVVLVIVTIVTNGLTTPLLITYVKGMVVAIGASLAIQLVLKSSLSKELKVALVTVLSIASIAVGGGFQLGNTLQIMTTALNVLNLTTNAISIYFGLKTEEFADKTADIQEKARKRNDELNEKNSELRSALLRRQMLMDSFNEREYMLDDDIKLLISNDAFMYMCKEAYLNFDLCLEGNMDSISNYVDSKKQLRIEI